MSPDIDQTLIALSDKQRRAIVQLLGERPLRPSHVADALGLSRPALSRHLRVLRNAGIVSQGSGVDDARVRVISLQKEPFTQLRSWVEEVEAFWSDQLDAFKEHAEKEGQKKTI